jgi:arylsulfatase A-like enzyme
MLEASRRHFLKAIAAAPLIGSAHRGRERPNLILLMADDLSARELGCYGNRDHATPNLDALARSGVRVETCWATPLCSPTRAELMTGRYGFRTGWYHNGMKPAAESPQAHLAQSNLTFAQLLKAAGYATAICGKWQLNGTVAEHAFDESCLWEDYPGFSGPRETAVDGKQSGRPARYWHPAIVENGTPLATTAEDYGPDLIADFVLDFTRRHRGQPFLIYYPMLLPHIAWDFEREMETWIDVPGLDEAGHPTGVPQRGSLQANIEYLDRLVGRIVEGLDALDLRERTILLFTSDNGSQGYGKNITVRERGPRVPLIVNGPTRVAARGAVEQLVDLSDILPTLVELAGGALPEGYAIDGRSFATMLMNRPGPERDWIFSCLGDRRFLRTRRWLLDGDRRFWDCRDRRDEDGYRDVTRSERPKIGAARERLDGILADLPPPPRSVVRQIWRANHCFSPRPISIRTKR